MTVFEIIAVAGAGYLLGSIPFAVIIARFKGVDILKVGSGNPGATNVRRAVGRGAGNLCFLCDALKGAAAAGWPQLSALDASNPFALAIIGLLAAILGHSFSVFLKFRGGKGVATTVGGLLVLMPWVLLIGLVLWVAVFQMFRYVSLASMVLGLSLPLSSLILGRPPEGLLFSAFLAGLIVVRHRSNISRLLAGTESRVERKK